MQLLYPIKLLSSLVALQHAATYRLRAAAVDTSTAHQAVMPPSPYEYALMSTAIYEDHDPTCINTDVAGSRHTATPEQQALQAQGWELADLIRTASGYYGGLYLHHARQQVVIAHRGSQNVDSWVTDLQSIVGAKPGGFVQDAILALSHPLVQQYCRAIDTGVGAATQPDTGDATTLSSYQLTTTGHSLGGFLAQVCVFWAQQPQFAATHYPDISAMVFDSPGALDLLEVLQSNLVSERARIRLAHLDIQNFCPMPTFASTLGRHVGTVWYLGANPKTMRFAFFIGHKTKTIIQQFDPATGQPKVFYRMPDWPQADYRNYASLTSTLQHTVSSALRAPLDALNQLYKQWPGTRHETWYDRLFTDGGQVDRYFQQVGQAANSATLENTISTALQAHYSVYSTPAQNEQVIDMHHFPQSIQRVLNDLDFARRAGARVFEHREILTALYSPRVATLLQQFTLETQGEKTELYLHADYEGTVFDFRSAVLAAGAELIPTNALAHFVERCTLAASESLPDTSEQSKDKSFYSRTAVADGENAKALRMVSEKDFSEERMKRTVDFLTQLRDAGLITQLSDADIHIDGAVAKGNDATALVFEETADDKKLEASLNAAAGFFSRLKGTDGVGTTTEQPKEQPLAEEDVSPKKQP